jgi:hypothetical protein
VEKKAVQQFVQMAPKRIILLPASLPHPGGKLACGDLKTVRAAFSGL